MDTNFKPLTKAGGLILAGKTLVIQVRAMAEQLVLGDFVWPARITDIPTLLGLNNCQRASRAARFTSEKVPASRLN